MKKITSILLIMVLAMTLSFSNLNEAAATNNHPDNLVSGDTFSSVYDLAWYWNLESEYHNLNENVSLYVDYIGVSNPNVDVDLVFYCEYEVGFYSNVGKIDLPDMGFTEVTPAMMSTAFTNACRTHWRFEVEVDDNYYNGRQTLFNTRYEGSLYIGYTNPNADITPPVFSGPSYFATDIDNLDTETYIRSKLSATDETDGSVSINLVTDNYSGQVSGLGTYTIEYSASDLTGNSQSFTITVEVFDITKPVISLTGSTDIYLEYQDSFTEPGYSCTDNYDTTCTVSVTGSIDTNTLGSQTLTYNVSDTSGNDADTLTRTVHVQDTTKPIITLSGNSSYNIELGSIWTDPGASVTDNYEVAPSVVIGGDTVDVNTTGTYVITYDYTDSSGNAATQLTRTVTVEDNAKPVIALTGDTTVYLEFGETYEEPGVLITDNYDNDLTPVIANDINYALLGTYTVTYNVTDSSGNAATEITRTVVIQDTTAPVLTVDPTFTKYNSQFLTLSEIVTGFTAVDNYDGNITSNVSIQDINYNNNQFIVGSFTADVVITDSSGNSSTIEVTIEVLDDLPPEIILAADVFLTEEQINSMTIEEIREFIQNRPE